MPRYKLTIEYDGAPFHGWQKQDDLPTVQGALEAAFAQFCRAPVDIICAGRTDAGVHARGQVAHVDFHARFDAKQRHYLYRIVNRSSWPTIDAAHAWHVPKPMDIDAVREAASYLIGHHDFTTFRDRHCQAKSAMRTIDAMEIKQLAHRPEQWMVKISARSFLHHQVRNMMGALMLVGTGKWTPEQMREARDARDRVAGGPTAPAHALYFKKVDY